MVSILKVQESEEWFSISVARFNGLNLALDSEQIPEESLLQAINVISKQGLLQTDFGVKTYQHIVYGDPRAVWRLELTTGSVETMLITDKVLYRKATGDIWEPIDNGDATTTTDTAEIADATVIGVTATTGFTVGQLFSIKLDNNNWHVSEITVVTGGVSVTIADGIPTAAASGQACFESKKLAGTAANPVVAVTIPFEDAMVFTNGVDNVQRYVSSGATLADVSNLPSSGDTKCKAVALFDNSLILLNTIEGGTAKPSRVRWCEPGDTTDWTGDNASFVDLFDNEDDIMYGKDIGPYLAIYRTKSINRGIAENSVVRRFDFPVVITGEGIFSTNCVIDLGDEHLIVGNQNIYTYEGGFELKEIGDDITYDVFTGPAPRMEHSLKARTFALLDEIRELAYIFYPDAFSTDHPNRLMIYNLKTKVWTERDFGLEFSGGGSASDTSILTWNDLIGSWLDQTFTWGGSVASTDRPILLLCHPGASISTDPSFVYQYDGTTSDDDGTAIVTTIDTKDFGLPHMESRMDYIDILASGNSVEVLCSIDKGASWTSLGSQTLSSVIRRYRYWQQKVFRTIRFRITSPANVTQLQGIAFKSIIEYED